jgi:hypothetical protein
MVEGNPVRVFEHGDIVWLQEKFKRERSENPDLSLEEFAIAHGVDPKLFWVEDVNVKPKFIMLYHGTSRKRALRIIEEGFRVKRGVQKRIWFTLKRSEAERIARRRAKLENDTPIVLTCRIDLVKYPYTRPNPNHYAFKCERIGPEVIVHPRGIRGIAVEPEDKKPKPRRPRERSVPNICITRVSGRTGIAFWMNAFFKLEGDDAFRPDSPLVKAGFRAAGILRKREHGRNYELFEMECRQNTPVSP